MLNLAIVIALGKSVEVKLYVGGAISSGLTISSKAAPG